MIRYVEIRVGGLRHFFVGLSWPMRKYVVTSVQKWSGYGQWGPFTYGWNNAPAKQEKLRGRDYQSR